MNLLALLRTAVGGVAAGTLLCGCSLGQAQSAILVDTDSTTGTAQSLAPFRVSGPWQVRYTFDCTKQNSEEVLNVNQFTLDVFNGDDNSTAFEHPQTTFVAVKRQGTLNFSTPGNYYLHVDTQCDWTLQAVDLSSGPVASASAAPRVPQPHGTVALDVTFASVFGPYNCNLTGTVAALCAVGDGTVGTSPFGALRMHRTFAVAAGVGDCFTSTTTGTLTAANGDVLDVQSTKGQACKRSNAASYSFTVTGGTGIFKNATGSGTIADQHGTSDRWNGSITFAP
ncbi:MAG TPA: hypothetical protein VN193_12175 [Candidatus Angelobacter sp.]|nr:hypothetical protein [Candidatus Angelobacter sp.]